MFELGMKSKVAGADKLPRINISGRPTRMPALPSANHRVICGYDQGLGERLIVVESLEEMQELDDAYYHGGALSISWYIGEDPGAIEVIVPLAKEEVTAE